MDSTSTNLPSQRALGRAPRWFLFSLAVAAGLLITVVGPTSSGFTVTGVHAASGAVIQVDSSAQEVPPVANGNCTLGEAIQAANTDSAVDACPPGSGPDTVLLAAQTYTLTAADNLTDGANALPSVTSEIAIVGVTSDTTILSRTIEAPAFRILHVGANGKLTLSNLAVRGGSTITDSNGVGLKGGGVFSSGQLTIFNSRIVSNVAWYGGGIWNEGGMLVVADSSILHNLASDFGEGGGIGGHGVLSVDRSLVSSNTAVIGGGIVNVGHLHLSRSTLAGNQAGFGGAVVSDGALTITASALFSNTARYYGGALMVDGAVTIISSTLSANTSEVGGAIFADGTVSLVGSTVTRNSAKMGGAIVSSGMLTVSTTAVVHNTAPDGIGGGIANTGGTVVVTGSVLSGNQAGLAGGAILNEGGIRSTGTLTLSHSTLVSNTAETGGALYNESSGVLMIADSFVTQNTAADGGGISNRGALTVLSTTIGSNTASGPKSGNTEWNGNRGGGIINLSGILTLSGSTVISNTATNYGGGIANDATVAVAYTTLAGNSAYLGAGVDNNGVLTLTESLVSGNTAEYGAGLYNRRLLFAASSTLAANEAGVFGGGIMNDGTLTVLESSMSKNSAGSGGGIANFGDVAAVQSRFFENDAMSGGAFYNDTEGFLAVTASHIARNVGGDSGGIANHGALTLTSSTLSTNASSGGGALYNTGVITVANSTLSGNTAEGNRLNAAGGAVLNDGGRITFANSTIAGNTAVVSGTGGVRNATGGTVSLSHTILTNGSAGANCLGPVLSGGYNLERGSSCGLSQPGDRSYTAPLLGPLQQNGGPTPTHSPLPGSPAIDGGDLAGCKEGTGAALSADQRGQARPVDGDGNGGAICDIGAVESGTGGPVPSGMMTDDTAAGLTYDGWGGARDAAASGGGYRVAGAAGETIRYRAARMSRSVTLLTFRGPSQGKARVTIDGVSSTTVDLYSPRPAYQVPLTFSGLALRRHTVEVTALGEKSVASNGTRVRVDGFHVRGVTVEESSPQVRYGNWMGRSDTRAHGGSYRYSATPGATLFFRFSGTRFRWVTTRGPSHGWAQVIVDGKVIMTVDLYSPVVQWQFPQEIGGLTRGTHTVQIKALGAHSRGSRGNIVVFDGFSVP